MNETNCGNQENHARAVKKTLNNANITPDASCLAKKTQKKFPPFTHGLNTNSRTFILKYKQTDKHSDDAH